MKIAFVADDAQTISAHFGRAPQVVVITVEGGKEVAREVRSKEAHGQEHEQEHDHDHSHDHGHHQRDHSSKFEPMRDCNVLVVRGMGAPAFDHARSMGLEVFMTAEKNIDAALAAYLAGKLDNDDRRIHQH
jgi:predicted Fe-Mo cluster-binding NifX family protein